MLNKDLLHALSAEPDKVYSLSEVFTKASEFKRATFTAADHHELENSPAEDLDFGLDPDDNVYIDINDTNTKMHGGIQLRQLYLDRKALYKVFQQIYTNFNHSDRLRTRCHRAEAAAVRKVEDHSSRVGSDLVLIRDLSG